MIETNSLFLNEKFKEGKIKFEKGKKPYIKEIEKISKFAVWLVDGAFIRENICEDFANFDQHFHLNFIPKYEFWIEKEAVPGEEKYYIDHLLLEWRLMSKGMKYEEALKLADTMEKQERKKSEIMASVKKLKSEKELLDNIHKKLLLEGNGKLKIWLVNGELVRDKFFVDYFAGGHDKVYHFIPDGEVWIDDHISAKERKFIILHELHERTIMAQGHHYRKAHLSATEVEDLCRHHPSKLKAAMKEELRKV